MILPPSQASEPAFLDYRLRWRTGQTRTGTHRARSAGDGGDFHAVRPFWQVPDARRIDLRRSIADPFGTVMVRQAEQRSAVAIVVAADCSHSMQPCAARSLVGAIAALAEAAARSAGRAADGFGLITFDRTVRSAAPPSWSRVAARQMVQSLAQCRPAGTGAEGIACLGPYLPAQRCLLLLVSDFRMPLPLLAQALVGLEPHDIAPVVLDLDGPGRLPRTGLVRLRDVESGRHRLLLMRPALHARWRQSLAEHDAARDRLFRRHGRAPFLAGPRLDIAALSDHLMAG